MKRLRAFFLRLGGLFGNARRDRDFSDEMKAHLEMHIEDNLRSGMSPAEARRQALLKLGGLEQTRLLHGDRRGLPALETLFQDLRYALRMPAKNPGFTAVAVLTLALGIGANTAIFSVVNGVLLNPLPYAHPEQLVTLHESKPNFDTGSISYPNFRDWQKQNHTFSFIAIARHTGFTLTGLGEAEQVDARFVSSDFFSLLSVNPVIGRTFLPGEDEIGAAPVAVISEGLWKRKFGASSAVLGKTITLDGKGYTIVGVIPASFHLFMQNDFVPDIHVPIGQWSNSFLSLRGAGLGIHGIGRLKPGVSIEQARADMAQVTRNLAAAYPDEDQGIGATIVPFRKAVVGNVQGILLVLLGAVGFVLLIACVNVANLQLARSTSRASEFAIRSALGAGHGRLVRQLLTESVLLAFAGGALGLLLAQWGVQAALSVLPAAMPCAAEIHIDGHVLLFAFAASFLAGILFGLVPALKTSRIQVHETLKKGGRGSSGTRHRAQGVLIALEMALALVLLIGAGLTIRSLVSLWRVNPGFEPHNVLTFNISFPPSMTTATPDVIRAHLREVDRRFASAPGVQAISASWGAVPLQTDDEQLFWLEGHPKPPTENEMNWALNYVVEPDYLKVMGIPLVRGRFFTPRDDEHAAHVVVVDDVFARKFFGDENPIGKRLNLLQGNSQAEIVGIVGHVKQWGLDLDDTQQLRAQMYMPYMQLPDNLMKLAAPGTTLLVRSDGTVPRLFDELRRVNQRMSGEQVIYGAQTMDQTISSSLAARRFTMILFGIFAAIALLLSSVGIFGVVSYLVGQRTQEIGIRMALGAKKIDVLRLILGEGMKMAGVGVLIGLLAAFGLTRLMDTMLFGVSATDPLTFFGVALLLTAVALAACWIPARRAMRVDPMVALRYE